MIASFRRILTPRLAILPIGLAAIIAASCTLVGQGPLNRSNDLSGIGVDNTTLRAYAYNTGDTWPSAGEFGVVVQGDDFGSPPSYGMNGTLLLVTTDLVCPMSEGAPEGFQLADVTPIGTVPVLNGRVNQALRVTDTTSNRKSQWALIEPAELMGYPGLHKAHRCGTIAWTAASGAGVDACTLRTSLDGDPLSTGKAFALDMNTKWQFCNGGAAAGSSEKFLFKTVNGGASWSLISRTTLGSPPPEAGVGELPNGNGVSAVFFQNGTLGWLGLSSPGHNFLKSTDGGTNWQEVVVSDLDPGVPVTSISFSDAMNGIFVTPDGDWTTDDGGASWTMVP